MALIFLVLAACTPDPVKPDDSGATTGPADSPTDSRPTDEHSGDSPPDSPTGHSDCQPSTWYADADADGFGDPASPSEACEAPAGAVADSTDCDDTNPAANPGAVEVCDGADNDCVPNAEAGIVSVGTSVYGSIQEAVDDAPEGETVSICEGTWPEVVVVSKALTLHGVAGAELTVLDAGLPAPARSALTIQRAAVRVLGLTITGGTGTMMEGDTWGGGVYAGQSDGVELVDCVVTGNVASFGAGVLGTGLYPAMERLTNVRIEGNSATMGGGGFLLFHAELEAVEVTGNDAFVGGGGTVWYWDVTADAATSIWGNEAEFGGGLYPWDEGHWIGGEIRDNYATSGGGGVYASDDSTVDDAAILGNSTPGPGGGMYVQDAVFSSSNLIFNDNVAASGGAVALEGGRVSFTSCDLGAPPVDNSPDDVAATYAGFTTTYQVDGVATFSCSAPAGCVGL